MKMNLSKVLATLLALIMVSSMTMAQSFEGVITYNTTNSAINEKATVKWFHKNGQNVLDFDSNAGDQRIKYSMRMNSKDESVFLSTDKGSQQISGITGEEVFTTANYVRKAKTTEAGYDCEMLMFKSNGNDLTYWVTSDISLAYGDLPKLFRNNMPSFAGISNGFPLKMELRDSSGNLLRSQEVVSVESKKIDDSKFKM